MGVDIRSLTVPVVGAPMAGGPSTPALVAAVSGAGGLGFLAGGYLTAEQLTAQIRDTQQRTDRPFGVNLFVIPENTVDEHELERYARQLEGDARALNVIVGQPRWDDDDLDAKVDAVIQSGVAIVSFAFGIPDPSVIDRLVSAGIRVAITVTSVPEARAAELAGAHVLVIQGPEAGGHRSTFLPGNAGSSLSLSSLVSSIRAESMLPLVAGGGIATAGRASAVIAAGATAVQIGTALLLSHEAGTSATAREALTSGAFTETIVTRAFTGRAARALRNDFIESHSNTAPHAFPQLHYMTAPLRAAAARAHDAQRLHLWAGTGFAECRQASAEQIVTGMMA